MQQYVPLMDLAYNRNALQSQSNGLISLLMQGNRAAKYPMYEHEQP